MKSPDTKTKLRAVLKAAIVGGLIFAILTVVAMLGAPIFGGFPYLLAGIPETQLEIFLTGKMLLNSFNGSFFLYVSCCMIVNGVLGALVCAVFAFLRQLMKDNRESGD